MPFSIEEREETKNSSSFPICRPRRSRDKCAGSMEAVPRGVEVRGSAGSAQFGDQTIGTRRRLGGPPQRVPRPVQARRAHFFVFVFLFPRRLPILSPQSLRLLESPPRPKAVESGERRQQRRRKNERTIQRRFFLQQFRLTIKTDQRQNKHAPLYVSSRNACLSLSNLEMLGRHATSGLSWRQ